MTHAGGDPDDPMRIGGVGRTQRPEGPEAAGAVDVEQAQGIEASSGAAAAQSTDAIADALATGAIDAAEARAALIEQVVRAQVPAGADPAFVAELQAEVAALLESDPLLEALLRPG